MTRRWRLLIDGSASGYWNMGVDEALLASAARGVASLRLYSWDGPWLSLGYGQPLSRRRERACASAGVGVVRRSTGGRAVLHGGDLTYAVAAPETWLPSGLAASYACIAGALATALGGLGIETTRARPALEPSVFDCFARPAGEELCARGRKLAGAAQRRADGAVLQHGSLRLTPDPPAAREGAGLGDAATSLRELGFPGGVPELVGPLSAAFAGALCARFECAGLDAAERAQAGRRRESPAGAAVAPISRPPLTGR